MAKYRQATGRGLGQGGTSQPPTPVTRIQAPDFGTKSESTPSQNPPARKKLKLSVRKPSTNDGDTIAVSRPKRSSTVPRRYSEDVFVNDNDKEVNVAPSPAGSSELSSLDTPPKPDGDAVSDRRKSSKMAEYGSFMDYYVLDDGKADDDSPILVDDDPEPDAVQIESTPSNDKLQTTQPSKHQTEQSNQRRSKKSHHDKLPRNHGQGTQQAKPSTTRHSATPIDLTASSDHPTMQYPPPGVPVNIASQHSSLPSVPPRMPPHMQQHPRPMPPPPPIPHPEPPVMEEITVKYHAPVAEMVSNVWALCTALANVGGVAPAKPQPAPQSKKATRQDKVGGFLDLFDDDGSDSESINGVEAEKPAEVYLERQGEPDSPLTYGIQFIMNALKSWAQTRLYQQQVAALQASHSHGHNHAGQPGSPAPQPPTIKINLDETPEGQAIAAFRKVVESGCLQLNVRMPQELSDAVCHLYMQIDKLINQQGNRGQSEYQPMSYSAQIAANRVRVARWREQEAHMFFEHQQMMQQMALNPHFNNQWQAQHHQGSPHDVTGHSGRRRGRPPGSHKHHRSSQVVPTSAVHGGSFPPPHSQSGTPIQGQVPPGYLPPGHDGSIPGSGHLDKMQIYTAALPMSGQKMKFSFVPDNKKAYEEALKAFGPEAFPQGLPPGHMITKGGVVLGPLPDELPPSAMGSHARPRSSVGSVHAGEGHGHPVPGNDFTPVNQTPTDAASASPAIAAEKVDVKRESADGERKPAPSAFARSPSAPRASTDATQDLASRYPHPGAVVIDE